jgi:hypothetical protein
MVGAALTGKEDDHGTHDHRLTNGERVTVAPVQAKLATADITRHGRGPQLEGVVTDRSSECALESTARQTYVLSLAARMSRMRHALVTDPKPNVEQGEQTNAGGVEVRGRLPVHDIRPVPGGQEKAVQHQSLMTTPSACRAQHTHQSCHFELRTTRWHSSAEIMSEHVDELRTSMYRASAVGVSMDGT